MAKPTYRVFLHAGGPELANFGRHLEAQLLAHPQLAFAPTWVEATATKLPPEMQEADLFVTLSLGVQESEATRSLREKAKSRRAILFPFLLATETASMGVPTAGEETTSTIRLETREGVSRLITQIATILEERVVMGSPYTDLLLRWNLDDSAVPSEDPYRQSALALLRAEGTELTGQLKKLALESRQQAATAITAHFPEIALQALRQAADHDATSAITAYWIARLEVYRNQPHSLETGLCEATRAARLAALEDDCPALESAAWRLAARIAAMKDDPASLDTYLRSAAALEPAQQDLQLERLSLYHRGGMTHRALEELSELYAQDRSIARPIEAHPEYVPFRAHLQTLHEQRTQVLRAVLEEVWKSQQALCQYREATQSPMPVNPSDPEEDILDWLERKIAQSLAHQLELLNAWGQEIVSETIDLGHLREDLQSLSQTSREPPSRSDFDSLLERVWPRLRERFAALDKAMAETVALEASWTQREAQVRTQLEEDLTEFVDHAARFESLFLEHHERFDSPALEAVTELRELVVLKVRSESLAPTDRLDGWLPEDLCEALGIPNPNPGLPGLYRLETLSSGEAQASRSEIYFRAARQAQAKVRKIAPTTAN